MVSARVASAMPREVDWERLDKRKFFITGVGVFSGVTMALYPLSVIKTRQMVSAHATQARMTDIAREVMRERGIRGFYRGFGTIVVGAIPIRVVYLSTLEAVKARTNAVFDAWDVPVMYRGAADAAGGGDGEFGVAGVGGAGGRYFDAANGAGDAERRRGGRRGRGVRGI